MRYTLTDLFMNTPELHKLGDYIQEIDERNSDLIYGENDVLGISTSKCFMQTRGNLIGVSFDNYKVVRDGYFAYNVNTARMGDRIAIALRKGRPCIVSSIYPVFRVKEGLLADYLMLWFKRPEFDRYARFMSHGSARETFEYSQMCDVLLPIPSIEEQQRIVDRYNKIQTRIEINKSIICQLEEADLRLYHKLFVDNIDTMDLPVGWRKGELRDVASFEYGKMPKLDKTVDVGYPIYSGYSVTRYYSEYTIERPAIIVIARGDAGSGDVCMSPEKCFLSNLAIHVKVFDEKIKYFLYRYLLEHDTKSLRTGSAQAQVTINNLELFDIIIPPKELYSLYYNSAETIQEHIRLLKKDNELLNKTAATINV